jgi:hypothetical protein
MPHYKDGKEAFIGDFVRGKPSNTPHEVAGRIVSITKGSEACNMEIAFPAMGSIADLLESKRTYANDKPFRMAHGAGEQPILKWANHQYTEKGYLSGTPTLVAMAFDYGDVCNFELISRPADAYPCPDRAKDPETATT